LDRGYPTPYKKKEDNPIHFNPRAEYNRSWIKTYKYL
jgi:hypothetical protein